MFTHLWTDALTSLSLEFPCALMLSFPLYLYWTLSGFPLLDKILLLIMYLLSSTMIGFALFWPTFFSQLCVFDRYLQVKSQYSFSLISFLSLNHTKSSATSSSSVSTISWITRQFWREYCSCFSIPFSRFLTFLLITNTFLLTSWLFVLVAFFLSHTRQMFCIWS